MTSIRFKTEEEVKIIIRDKKGKIIRVIREKTDKTPTNKFWDDLFTEMTTGEDQAILQPLYKMCIVDTYGMEEVCTSGNDLDKSKGIDYVGLHTTVTYPSTVPFNTIRIYAGSDSDPRHYFETNISTVTPPSSNITIEIYWKVKFTNINFTAKGFLVNSTIHTWQETWIPIVDILYGSRGASGIQYLRIDKIIIRDINDTTLIASKDNGNLLYYPEYKMLKTKELSPPNDMSIHEVALLFGDPNETAFVWFILTSELEIRTIDKVKLTIKFSGY